MARLNNEEIKNMKSKVYRNKNSYKLLKETKRARAEENRLQNSLQDSFDSVFRLEGEITSLKNQLDSSARGLIKHNKQLLTQFKGIKSSFEMMKMFIEPQQN